MGSKRKRIFVLDSDADFLIAIERLLEDQGFETTTTWDVGDATALLGCMPFDILLVGKHSPELKSSEMLQRLRALAEHVPFIVLQSAPCHPFEAQYFRLLGADAVVSKRSHTEIVETVRRFSNIPMAA